MKKQKNIIIIGAGPAGLSTAYEMLKRSGEYKIKVLEKSDAIGGISRTVNANVNRMDIGGHRFFTKEKLVNDIWSEIMYPQGAPAKDEMMLGIKRDYPSDGLDPEQSDDVMLIRRRVSRIYFKKKFFDYPVSLKFSTIKNMGFWNSVLAGFSYIKSATFKRKEKTLEDFYINRFGKKLYRMFFESYTEKVWGRHPREMSADWGGQRVKGLSVRTVIKNAFGMLFGFKANETSLIEEFYYPKFGPGQLFERMADKIDAHKNGAVLKNAELVNIICKNDKVAGVRYKLNGKTVEESADIVISSMPLNELIDAIGEQDGNVLRIAHSLPFRDFITIGFLVDKLKLKNKTKLKTVNDIIPDCWIYVQDKSVKLGRIQIFNNWSPYMVKNFPDKIWIGLEYFANEGDELWNMPVEYFKQMAAAELEKIGVINQEDVEEYHCEKIKKAYCAYFDTYAEIDILRERLLQYDGLYCIGRNGQHRYNNMDHSTMTGIETVNCILDNTLDKAIVWNVNTENDYHETKGK